MHDVPQRRETLGPCRLPISYYLRRPLHSGSDRPKSERFDGRRLRRDWQTASAQHFRSLVIPLALPLATRMPSSVNSGVEQQATYALIDPRMFNPSFPRLCQLDVRRLEVQHRQFQPKDRDEPRFNLVHSRKLVVITRALQVVPGQQASPRCPAAVPPPGLHQDGAFLWKADVPPAISRLSKTSR